jgi:hypothetical protein
VFPPQSDQSLAANSLVIFTGTAAFERYGSDERVLYGVVRVRLGFELKSNVKYLGSASVASLASIYGSDEDSLWAVDSVDVSPEPTAGGLLPANGLPTDELYLILEAAGLRRPRGPDANRLPGKRPRRGHDTGP